MGVEVKDTKRLRIYSFDMMTVFSVLGGAMTMEGSMVFPDQCIYRGSKIEDDKLLVCVQHESFEECEMVDKELQIPIFDLSMQMRPVVAEEPKQEDSKPKSDLIIL